jgi:multiple antibiotic resistance protein
MYGPASIAINTLHSNYVRFSVLAVSSIFFLVDPFAAIPAFLAITEGADRKRQQRMARRGALTCLIVLVTFALAGKLIFRMFGITLPAFLPPRNQAKRQQRPPQKTTPASCP